MIIIDFSQISIAALMMQEGLTTLQVDENFLRHMVLNSLRALVKKFRSEYGTEVIIACDSGSYWRKGVFPAYKANRKKKRDISGIDWKLVFKALNKIKSEIKVFFPYKLIEVDGAEADDVIAVLVKKHAGLLESSDDGSFGFAAKANPILIVSGDNDFFQLHDLPGVKQFSNTKKEFLGVPNVGLFLKEKIIRGEAKDKDGIPNIMSEDEIFLTEKRQSPVTQKRLDEFMAMTIDQLESTTKFARNRLLIDFNYIPENITTDIVAAYGVAKPGPKNMLLQYFMHYQLQNLMENLTDF